MQDSHDVLPGGADGVHFAKAVEQELQRQRDRDQRQRQEILQQRTQLDELLKGLGKPGLAERSAACSPRGDSSVMCYPLAADAGKVVTRGEISEWETERGPVYGLVSQGHPEFAHCKGYARAAPDASDQGVAAELRGLIRQLSARVESLENENATRTLEVRVLRRLLDDSGVVLSPGGRDALAALGSRGRDPPGMSPKGSEEAREAQRQAVERLAQEGLGSLLRAAYSEPGLLRSLGQVDCL
eukprot:TRINITY_DN12702_c0_g1_i1.p1 TRINITY_DN12702_c0_g1~~TRINITY_DN12702_c0_g1_i1.p1  ORF type:complete len:242 (+),score=63.70 TRINITY_DN12702_c0_g1_i1:90-815(+)